MQRFERWISIAGVAVLSLIAAAGICLAVYSAWLFHDMPDASDLVNYRPPTATRVYAWDGTLIGEFSRERRIFVPYDQIPPRVVKAFMAAEDRNFYEHSGIDYQGLSRAVLKNVLNVSRGRRLEGGSTITQQVAKNVLLNSDVTFGRKFKEAILANRLEQVLSKPKIMELYLNEIWLGYRSFGVGAAAYNYFGKPLSDLTLAETAYLAALPKGPQNYQPVRNKANAIRRRNWIIGEMAELGWVTRQEAEVAIAADLKVQAEPSRARYRDADYFIEEVRQRAILTLGDKVNEGGYYLRTTLDIRLQTAARVALMQGLELYDRRHGWRGAVGRVELGQEGWQKKAKALTPPYERRDWVIAVVEAAKGPVKVRLTDGKTGSIVEEDVVWARATKGFNVGELIFVAPGKSPGQFALKQIPTVNGALVAIDPYSGRVLALVGGYSFSLSKFNRATQAKRQPGSAFKPFVYATALDNGYTPASVVADAPITIKGETADKDWTPENYSKDYYGNLVLRKGLEQSRNAMTVRLAQAIGMDKVRETAIRMGVVKDMSPVLAMSLGSGETTPFKLTAAYAPFVNGGRRIEPHLIELVQDREGKPLLKGDGRDCERCNVGFLGEESPRLPAAGTEVLDPITAYQITAMLQGVVQRGTAAQVSSLGRPLAGKTGTTNEYRSAWFVGYSPEIVVGVFVGFDDNRSLGNSETGGQAAVPIFIEFMQTALRGSPYRDFQPPKTAKFVLVNGIREAFRPGTEPKPQLTPEGPVPYGEAWGGGPAVPPPPPPPKVQKVPEDLSGLY